MFPYLVVYIYKYLDNYFFFTKKQKKDAFFLKKSVQ